MRKLLTILITTVIAIAFVSCKARVKNEEVKKLPSRIVFCFDDENSIWGFGEFFYDEQNRLIKVIQMGRRCLCYNCDAVNPPDDTLNIIYNSDGLLVKLTEGLYNFEITYLDNGKKIIVSCDDKNYWSNDTFWLNNKGQVIKSSDGLGHIWEHTYNSKGNISKQRQYGLWWEDNYGQRHDYEFINKVTYSRIRPVFRHVNTPEWFLFWLFEFWLSENLTIHPFQKNGYLPFEKKYFDADGKYKSSKFTYELDTDNYVIKMKIKDTYFQEWNWGYQYILVK